MNAFKLIVVSVFLTQPCLTMGADNFTDSSSVEFIFDGGSIVYSYYDAVTKQSVDVVLVHPSSPTFGVPRPLIVKRGRGEGAFLIKMDERDVIAWAKTRVSQLTQQNRRRHDGAFIAAALYSATMGKRTLFGGPRAIKRLKRGDWVSLFEDK